jgi:Fe-S cluster assembly protein SufB
MLEWRLKAYRHWAKLEKSEAEPKWAKVHYPAIDYQAIRYYSAPKSRRRAERVWRKSIPSCSKTYEKLGIPLKEQERWPASPSMRCSTASRWRRRSKPSSARWGLFSARSARRCTIIRSWCKNIWARWCRTPITFFAALNSAVFTDGSFCYIPKGVRCPMELSTYFRINAKNRQFERTLIVADEGAT